MSEPLIRKLRKERATPKMRLKYSLTMDAHNKLVAASAYANIEMSTILEELIQRYLPPPGQLEAIVPPEVDFDLDDFSRELDR